VHYLVIDDRFAAPVYVFLDADPAAADGFPGLPVRRVELERIPLGGIMSEGLTIGQQPGRVDRFREFGSDRAATAARYGLIEPRYVGATWNGYARHFLRRYK
jgi:hypothetical protein